MGIDIGSLVAKDREQQEQIAALQAQWQAKCDALTLEEASLLETRYQQLLEAWSKEQEAIVQNQKQNQERSTQDLVQAMDAWSSYYEQHRSKWLAHMVAMVCEEETV